MTLTVAAIVVILAVGYAHMRDGLFTGLCMFVNVFLAGLVAFGFFEPIADWLDSSMQRNSWSEYVDFFVLIGLFAGTLLVLRALTNRLAPDILDFPPNAQYGGAGFGLLSGYFLAGFLICACETLPWHERFLDFQPRTTNDSGPRSLFPPDRVWLAMMRYGGAYPLAWEEDDPSAATRYDQYRTFDRHATFEQRYLRYRRYSDGMPPSVVWGSGAAPRPPLTYQNELDRDLRP